MIKYGIPQNFGAAAPIIDKLLGTTKNVQNLAKSGFETVSISQITDIHLTMIAMLFLGIITSFFTKNKFLNSSFLLITAGIFIIYFGPNMGLPLLTSQSRLTEYMFFAITILLSFWYYYLFYKPSFFILKKYAKIPVIIVSFSLFIIFSFAMPKWINTNRFWKNINEIEYTSISDIILKINKKNRPFTWTAISYVQEYAKVKNKAYHLNTQNFLLRYNPKNRYLKVPTSKIYIFVENFPNPYKGMNEWYYRWRSEIQSNLKSWIAIYNINHDNIKIYFKTKTITVYEIDNKEYIDYLKKGKK
ncbi:MAG: hypothetical protein GXP61_11345 [Epsilonproteobacteria bacterium]|nr:hypothetical protein [Campylobacterota bacterium]